MTGAHVALVARRKPFLEKVAAAALKKGAGSASVISADLSTHKGLVATVECAAYCSVCLMCAAGRQLGWRTSTVQSTCWC